MLVSLTIFFQVFQAYCRRFFFNIVQFILFYSCVLLQLGKNFKNLSFFSLGGSYLFCKVDLVNVLHIITGLFQCSDVLVGQLNEKYLILLILMIGYCDVKTQEVQQNIIIPFGKNFHSVEIPQVTFIQILQRNVLIGQHDYFDV
eukprot:TRINITY_DN28984_c0_g1_i5.p2 TRINITY_DN28984_c0_g1~~TRINITY_DN28984_c0_g1_i5.p2  ORF type:complete len:144 (+),score=3.09 TRINITY_DN28984_c0_g1_i5:25-456(+)